MKLISSKRDSTKILDFSEQKVIIHLKPFVPLVRYRMLRFVTEPDRSNESACDRIVTMYIDIRYQILCLRHYLKFFTFSKNDFQNQIDKFLISVQRLIKINSTCRYKQYRYRVHRSSNKFSLNKYIYHFKNP